MRGPSGQPTPPATPDIEPLPRFSDDDDAEAVTYLSGFFFISADAKQGHDEFRP